MKTRLLSLLCLLLPALTQAHELSYMVGSNPAVVLHLFHHDGSAFDRQRYEILRDGETEPYQSGHSDARGRIAFLPDRAGTWRVRTFSADGHGLSFSFTTDAAVQVTDYEQPFFERYTRVIAGAGLIFGAFGLISLFVRGKSA